MCACVSKIYIYIYTEKSRLTFGMDKGFCSHMNLYVQNYGWSSTVEGDDGIWAKIAFVSYDTIRILDF